MQYIIEYNLVLYLLLHIYQHQRHIFNLSGGDVHVCINIVHIFKYDILFKRGPKLYGLKVICPHIMK